VLASVPVHFGKRVCLFALVKAVWSSCTET
jgi:hypothetical protein